MNVNFEFFDKEPLENLISTAKSRLNHEKVKMSFSRKSFMEFI